MANVHSCLQPPPFIAWNQFHRGACTIHRTLRLIFVPVQSRTIIRCTWTSSSSPPAQVRLNFQPGTFIFRSPANIAPALLTIPDHLITPLTLFCVGTYCLMWLLSCHPMPCHSLIPFYSFAVSPSYSILLSYPAILSSVIPLSYTVPRSCIVSLLHHSLSRISLSNPSHSHRPQHALHPANVVENKCFKLV